MPLKFKHAAATDRKSWNLEIAIPFKSLGLRKTPFGRTWRGNLCRTRKPSEREVSAWANVEDGFHEPKSFGEWIFAGK